MTVRNEIHVFEGRRLGKHDPSDLPSASLGFHRAAAGYARRPKADSMTGAVPVLGGNDQFGTCGPTSVANYLIVDYWAHGKTKVTVADADVFELYRYSGNPNFDPATGAGDNGVDMKVMLAAYAKHGLVVTGPDGGKERAYPAAWAQLNHQDPGAIADGIDVFGAVLGGQVLQVAQQAQTDAKPPLWDYKRSATWGGHATAYGSYTGKPGAGVEDADCFSWAERVGTTDSYVTHQLDEGYAVVSPATLKSDAFNQLVNAASFAAAYSAMTGHALPVSPPAPAPADADHVFAPVLREYINGLRTATAFSDAGKTWLAAKKL